MQEAQSGAATGEPSSERPSWLARLAAPLAYAAAAAVLFPFLGQAGIWDPHELDVAELARRVAIHVWGARDLDLAGAPSSLPTLTDLGMGELPFTSIALGFRLFGLHDWAGRLPLAVWAFAGAITLYHFLARLVDRRAGLYAVLALVTMPLFFVQARTMLGDAVTMAALTMAFCGLAGAAYDEGARARGAWLALGLVGLGAGYLARGALLGVAVPALAVGLAWLVARGDPRERSLAGEAIGGLSLGLGVAAAALGLWALHVSEPGEPLRRALGVALLKKAPPDTTFDLPIHMLGHALFPWSAFLPLAVGRVLREPAGSCGEGARVREAHVRVALLLAASIGLAAYAWLGPYAGSLPFAGPALLAAIAAIAIVDLERGAPPSRFVAFATLALGLVLYADLTRFPEKAMSAYDVDEPAFPKSFEEGSARLLLVVLAALGVAALAWLEAQPDDLAAGPSAIVRRRVAECREAARAIGAAFGGNLVFGLVVIEAALVGLGAMVLIGSRFEWAPVTRLPKGFADLSVNLWYAFPLALGLATPLAFAARDAASLAFHASRLPRAAWASLAGVGAGLALATGYYPALAKQLSPKEVFETYAEIAPGAPLGLLGVRSRVGAYYDAGEVTTFSDATRAFRWLTGQEGERRFLVVQADDLPRLSSMFRKQARRNLPVLDGRSSQILLVSNELGDRVSQSPLDAMILDADPTPAHPVSASFEDQLEVLGWEVRDDEGAVVPSVVTGVKYRLRTYYRVLAPITGSWKAFLHIDGYQRRHNGDHAPLGGRYAMNLWQPGDVVVDDLEIELEPNFLPGQYTVFFGFFSGDTRFSVTRGPSQDDRVIGGPLEVR
jgi:4-amino-4-deoxy-L-arabinose transferase-like glycosyltransferase